MIETLARMLNVPYRWLRFGIPEPRPMAPSGVPDEASEIVPDAEELAFLRRYRKLSAHQQELVAGLVDQLVLNGEFWESNEAE